MVIINEPGLYSLIFRSKKLIAKIFKRWVTHEVLPTIRKTGSYQLDMDLESKLDQMYEGFKKVQRERDAKQAELDQLKPELDLLDQFRG